VSEALRLITFRDAAGFHPAAWVGDDAVRIPDAPDGETGLIEIIAGWPRWEAPVRAAAATGRDRTPLAPGALSTPLRYPGKLLIAGSNYASHVREMNVRRGKQPDIMPGSPFLVTLPTRHAIIGSGEPIVVPDWAEKMDWEIELAVVIGRTARRVTTADAMDYVFGYTIMNDITSRAALARTDVPFPHDFLSGKGADSFCPIGPCIVPKEDLPMPVELQLTVNGETMQSARTDDFVFDVPTTVAYASERITLDPGDVISTGTPGGVGAARGLFLRAGDRVSAAISGIGRLDNVVTTQEYSSR
jgi:2-keto-4-pentenoate hydratase/2-oxohepta-3-ene-1,7-dioic acid hydratase in catechol pathway